MAVKGGRFDRAAEAVWLAAERSVRWTAGSILMNGMNWAIPLAASLAAIAALFASRPSNKPLALVGALLIAGSGAWSAVVEYQRSRTADTVAALAYAELQDSLGKALSLLNQMLLAGSDGWLPKVHEERFSNRAAEMICNHLNVATRAPVVPHRTWLTWIAQKTQEIREELGEAITAYSNSLDPDVIRVAASLQHSFFLKFPEQRSDLRAWDRTQGYQRLPLLCYGLASIMQESLEELGRAYDAIRDKTERPEYPLPARNLSPNLGSSHYSTADLESWARTHPYAPSGRPPQ